MLALTLLALASGSSQLASTKQREWQTCLTQTATLWATKPSPDEAIVDAATIHCRDKLEAVMIVETDTMKAMGLTQAQSEELASALVGALFRMNRKFAADAISAARTRR